MNKRQKKKTRFRGENECISRRRHHPGYDIYDLIQRLNINPYIINRNQDRYYRNIGRMYHYIIGYKDYIFKDKYWKREHSMNG